MKKIGTIILASLALTMLMTGCTNNEETRPATSETIMPQIEIMAKITPFQDKWYYAESSTQFRRVRIESTYLIEEMALTTPEITRYVYLIKGVNNELRAYSFNNDNSYRPFRVNADNDTIEYANIVFKR